jgi:hypothetical protein
MRPISMIFHIKIGTQKILCLMQHILTAAGQQSVIHIED